MTGNYRELLLQSFLQEYSRIYLIDLEQDTIERIMEADDVQDKDPVFTSSYSEFNNVYSSTRLDPEYAQWRFMQGSIENIRKRLAEQDCFTLSYQMQDGSRKIVENRILEKRDGVPVKAFACIRKDDEERTGTAGAFAGESADETPEAEKFSEDALTLVKYKDEGVLPISPEKYKRIMLVNIKGAETPMAKLMAIAMGGGAGKKRPVDKLCDRLNEKGFEAFVYESPLDKMVKQVEAGGKMDLNLYFAGKNAIADFVAGQDLVISFFDVCGGHPTFGLSKGGGEIPWYVHELHVIGVSVNKPTMLADAPMLRTYINAYDSNEHTLDALVEALMTGKEAFKGQDPIDSYCGMFDTHM